MAVLPTGIGPVTGGYQIERSLRFNSADSAYLNRTPASTGNTQKITYSTWLKRGLLGYSYATILSGGTNGSFTDTFAFNSSDNLVFFLVGSNDGYLITSQVFRDPSAWYHLVLAIDTTQATASNRVKIYVNGVQITSFSTSTYPVQNYNFTKLNTSSSPQGIGNSGAGYYNGYFTEVNFIDGQALTPSSFGETDSATGVWKPKAYSGTYGTNGFYLKFADNSGTTSTTLGKDSSGNGNNWTPNNFSVTAGVGNDSLVDTPTSYGTDTGAGGEVRGNYCTMNPLTVATLPTLANGNLDVSVSATGVKIAQGTYQFPSSGKWYYECTFNNASSGVNGMFIGITSPTRGPNVTRSTAGAYFFYASSSGLLSSNGTDLVTGLSAISANEVFKVAVDIDNSKVWIGRGSTWYNSSGGTTGDPAAGTNPTFSISASGLTPMSGFDASSVSLSMNFGQRTWAQTCPSGYKALCTQNLPTPTIGATSTTQAKAYFDVKTYTGNSNTTGGTQVITMDMAPDLAWIKSRSSTTWNILCDAVRGANKTIYSNDTYQEESLSNVLNSFNSNGVTVATNNSYTSVFTNYLGTNYVGWFWKANGAGSTNTAGTITSTVSANTTAGFSIVTFTGTGAAGTIGHGLGVAPSMVIVKSRSATGDWWVYHKSLGNTGVIWLELTNAYVTGDYWNNTSPTSSVFSIKVAGGLNATGVTQVAYCFAPVAGYSAFGSYTGNSSADGPFVYTGFRPRYVLIKIASGGSGSWDIHDTARSPYNVMQAQLYADQSAAEASNSVQILDALSNGFKIRGSSGDMNLSGATYIYAAFAESPFKYSLAR